MISLSKRNFCFAILIPLLSILGTGCGKFGEKEVPPPTAQISSEGCTFPPLDSVLNSRELSEKALDQAISCAQEKVDTAFKKIKGKESNEISLTELKTLNRRKVIQLPLTLSSDWDLLEVFLELFHPQGQPLLAKKTTDAFFEWIRKNKWLWVHAINKVQDPGEMNNIEETDFQKRIEVLSGVLDLISDNFSLSQDRAWKLKKSLQVSHQAHSKDRDSSWGELTRDAFDSVWILKSLVLPDNQQGVRADLTGRSVKGLLNLALNLIRAGTLTRKWLLQGGVPSEIPEGMAREWKELAQRTRDHFQSDHYADIPIDLFSWALRNIDPTGNLALLAPDLVRICQRLTRDSEPHRGLHISGFLPFLDQSETLGDDFYQAGKQFSKESWEITYREALRDPKLKKVALKGPMLFFSGTHTNKDKPFRQLDQKLRWSQVVSGLIKRKLITKVFEAFEREPKDGLIPYTKSNEEGLREPIDLAYAFLRFVAVGKQGSGKKEGAEETEVQIPNQVIVKPGALSKVMGLIGDKWFPDGDGDGSLNAEEFFSVVQVYEDIQERAVQGSYAMAAQRYLDFHTFGNRSSLDGVSSTDDLFVRREIISKVAEVFSFNSYFLEKALIELEEKKRESLFHSLFPINYEAQPVEVFKRIYSENTPKPELLTFLLKREDFMAPAAILTMMDRLLIRCDKNENAVFEWSELSCVAPLLLEAGNQTVESSLIDLDPGVNDASRFLLKFLQIKGVPFLLGRIALVTGSIRDISPSADILALTRGVEDSLQTDWNQIARFIGWDGTEKNRSVWIQEAKKEFGACDLDNNGLIKNEAEWQCFEKAVLGSLIDTATDLLEASGGNLNAKQVLEAMVQSPVVKLAIRLSTQGEGRVDFILAKAGLASSPYKILCLLEEIVRRGVSLWELPN